MPFAIPSRIEMDASAHCQLACPSCPTASGATRAAMGAGHLDPEAFEKLLAQNPEIEEVELSNYGEMFLNPRLRELMRIAFERGVTLHADNGTNLNHASEETLEALVRYRFRSLSVSIDGASAESYSQYRRKGDFERVIGHIETINRFKREHRSGFPLLTWQFIVFGHNEHEIEAAKARAAKLGMAFNPKISWDDEFSPVKNRELVQIQTGLRATRREFYQATGINYMRGICYQLWYKPVLNWDGRVLGCCRNFWGEFGGNAFRGGLGVALAASGIGAAREALMGRAEMPAASPCATCELYLTMQQDGRWLTREEIANAEPRQQVTVSVAVDRGESAATHADVFLGAGREVNRLLLARPPAAQRLDLAVSWAVMAQIPPGEYTVYVLPKQLDPEFRKQYPALPPVTLPVTIAARPVAQEISLRLA